MATVKISDLPEITHLDNNTANTILLGVDTDSDVTAKFTVTTLAEGLFHNNSLKVGEEPITFSNTIAQFKSSGTPFLQVNLQNTDANSSGDYVATADIGTNANNFIDMGINGSTFSDPDYSAMQALDGYLYVQGSLGDSTNGNLIIGTASTGANVVIAPGGTTTENVVAHFTKNGLVLQNSAQIEFTDGSIQTTAAASASFAQQSFNTANSASSNTVIIQGVNLTQNSDIIAVNQYAQSGFATANDANGMAVGAYNKANNALANTSGTFAGNLNVNGFITLNTAGGIYQETASPSIMTANTTGSFQIVTKRGSTPKTWSFGEDGKTTMPGDVTVTGNIIANGIATTNLISFISSTTPATNALVEIIGSNSGLQQTPANDGYMLHITGKDTTAARVVIDSFGANNYPLIAGRVGRGTAGSPTATQNNDVMMRVSSGGWGTTGFSPLGSGRIDFVASENYTDAARGSQIRFYNVANGTNTINQIATFNANSVEFAGVVVPSKGFIYVPKTYNGAQTAITLDFANDTILRAQTATGLTVTLSNFVYGKVVEMWITNTSGNGQTFTHGCSALNSTVNSTTYAIPATSSILAKYMSFDGDAANTFVSIIHA